MVRRFTVLHRDIVQLFTQVMQNAITEFKKDLLYIVKIAFCSSVHSKF